MQLKTILIDFDNTLHNTDAIFEEKFDGLLGLDGKTLWDILFFKIHREIVTKRFPHAHGDLNLHIELLFDHLKRPYDENQAKEILNRFREGETECWKSPRYYADTVSFLDFLESRKYRVFLTTGDHEKEKAAGIERWASKKYFEDVFGEEGLGVKKNSVEFYRAILQVSHSEPSETVSIGDTFTHDIAPAKEIGVVTIWVNRAGRRPDDRERPSFEVKDLSEAQRVITSLDDNSARS